MTRFRSVDQAAFSRAVRWHRHWMVQAGLLGVVLAMAPAWGQAQNAAPRFEVNNYVITAELLPSQHLLSANARIDIVPVTDVTSLAFELHSNLRVEKVDTSGQEVSFRQDGQALNLSLLNPLPAGKAGLHHRKIRGNAQFRGWQPGGRHQSGLHWARGILPSLSGPMVPRQRL